MCDTWLAPSSIVTYLASVRSLHIDLGCSDPMLGTPRLTRLIKGIKRARSSSINIRLPINNNLMHIIQASLSAGTFDHLMFWAACCVAFFGFLRVSEFTCPSAFNYTKPSARRRSPGIRSSGPTSYQVLQNRSLWPWLFYLFGSHWQRNLPGFGSVGLPSCSGQLTGATLRLSER